MKKLNTSKIFLILFMISSSATAQIEFGIKGGLNFNYANNETYLIEGWKKCSICTLESQYFNIFDKKLVIFLVYVKIKFGRFYLQPELLYAKINSEYDLTYTWNLLGEIINEFSENRIQIPVTVGIGLLQGKLNFSEVQPLISYLIYFTDNNENQSIGDLYEKSLITLQYGVSVDLGKIGLILQ